MGHEISYCARCAIRIGGADYDKGKAYRLGGKGICANCLTPDERQTIAESSAVRAKSTTRIKMQKPSPGTSSKLPVAKQNPKPPSKTPLFIGIAASAVVIAGAAFWMLSSPTPPPSETVVRPPDPKPVPRTPDPPKEEKPEDPQLRDAREALEAARAKSKALPDDLDAQRIAWEEAARKAALTPYFKDASAGLQEIRDKIAALKPVEPVKPPEKPVEPVKPPEPAKPAEPAAAPAWWTAAMSKASGGDYEGAAADFRKVAEGRPDADLLEQGVFALRNSREEVSRMAPGTAVGLFYRDGDARKRVEGTLVRAWTARLEIKQAEEIVFVEIADIAAGSIVDLVRPSAGLRPRYALICILEGDRDAAEKLVGADGFPPRYWEYAKDAAAKLPKVPQRELDARRLFYAAEREYGKPETLSEAISKYRTLADSYADTAVVKGELVRIKLRSDSGKDYLFTAFQLKGTPGYSLVAYPRSEAGWTSKADVDGAQAVGNYVAAEFTAMPGLTYRSWALIGACCTDTFLFYLQTTEGTDIDPKTRKKESIEPGAGSASVVKHTLKELARSHRSHVVKVPKSPVRWEWIPIPLPKYAAGGPKKIHLISDQQGFSVGAIVVSSTRTAPPSDTELKEAAGRAKASVVEQGLSLENPGEKAWRPLFDGKTKESILRGNAPGWKVEDGKLVSIVGINDAAQSREDFGDVDLRIRFQGQDLSRVWFILRQGTNVGHGVNFDDPKQLDGKVHELIILAKGDQVTVTLDGKPVPVSFLGPNARGPLQFNGFGKSFAILSFDVRP